MTPNGTLAQELLNDDVVAFIRCIAQLLVGDEPLYRFYQKMLYEVYPSLNLISIDGYSPQGVETGVV